MYDEIIEIAENRAYISAINKGEFAGPNVELIEKLKPYEQLRELEQQLRDDNNINFNTIFHEPNGYYLIKCFLQADYSVDKAVFISDVELYKQMRDISARRKVANLVYEQFITDDTHSKRTPGESVFIRRQKRTNSADQCDRRRNVHNYEDESKHSSANSKGSRRRSHSRSQRSQQSTSKSNREPQKRKSTSSKSSKKLETLDSFQSGGTNSIGVYGEMVQEVKEKIHRNEAPHDLFDKLEQEVSDDLRMDVFPRFLKSEFYKRYIQTKSLEQASVSIRDFTTLRVLGRGAFGAVKACIKKNTGKVYAMKCINKRRVMATDAVDTVMNERDFLSIMDSHFVVCLKYAVQDKDMLYLLLDLKSGGDLKFHLNNEELFSEVRARFYAAEVFLGLEHLHKHNIIFRDMKLENILLDAKGHCSLSDLGLSVRTDTPDGKVKGYAGTPGYTAPEVVKNEYYDKVADFFSFGVTIYRFLSGKKPFGRNRGDLDKNVIEIEPEYPPDVFSPDATDLIKRLLIKDPKKRLGAGPTGIEDIKNHPWFNLIDFGLLEAGYIDPPFKPSMDEVHADSLRHIGRPPDDEKYRKFKLSEQFDKSLGKFPFSSKVALQREIVEVLEKTDEGIDFRKFAANKTGPGRPPAASLGNTEKPVAKCCAIM